MPFVVLVVFMFITAMFFDKRATRRMYLLAAVGAIAATIYYTQ